MSTQNPLLDKTVKDLVLENFRTANVFERNGIDFCCGGGRTIRDVAGKKKIDPDKLEQELKQATRTEGDSMPDFSSWSLTLLVNYIIEQHHGYVRDVLPRLRMWLDKIPTRHGDQGAPNTEIASVFAGLQQEMMDHMKKEEDVQFPEITKIQERHNRGIAQPEETLAWLEELNRELEEEHRRAGDATFRLQTLTNDFTPPENACPTWQTAWQELGRFQKDLHRHVHIENHILFPRALEMARSSVGAAG